MKIFSFILCSLFLTGLATCQQLGKGSISELVDRMGVTDSGERDIVTQLLDLVIKGGQGRGKAYEKIGNLKQSSHSRSLQASVRLLECSLTGSQKSLAFTKDCFETVARDFPESGSAKIAKDSIRALTLSADSEGKLAFRRVAKLIDSTTLNSISAGVERELKSWLNNHGSTEDALELIIPAAAQLNGLGYHKLAAETLEHLLAVNAFAAKDAAANTTLADVYNMLGRSKDALTAVERASIFATVPSEKMRAEFAGSIALRDLHRMAEAQASLDRVALYAKQANDAGMESIVNELRSKGHSMDPQVSHASVNSTSGDSPRPPMFPPINVALAVVLFVGSGLLFFTSRRKIS